MFFPLDIFECLLVVHGETSDFCVMILYSVILMKVIFRFVSFLVESLGLHCLQMRVSWLFPSLFVPPFSLSSYSSGCLKWNALNFPLLKIVLVVGLTYTDFIILGYILFLLLQLPQRKQFGGLSSALLEVRSSHSHRHPQIQKGLLSSKGQGHQIPGPT